MANRHYSEFKEKKIKDNVTKPKLDSGDAGHVLRDGKEKTAGWKSFGSSRNINKAGFPKVKQSAKTTI